MAYGYRYGEVPLAELPETKDSGGVFIHKIQPTDVRSVERVSLGCYLLGAAPPHPDTLDQDTLVAGVLKRFLLKPPKPKNHLRKMLRAFVKKWLRANMTPLAPEEDCSVEEWLNNCNYPQWRKDQLRQCWKKIAKMENIYSDYRYFQCKSFPKDETHVSYKHVRGINSRSDEFKCTVGPIFKLIERELYKHPSFIKHVPVVDRPNYIYDMLYRVGAKYVATDYTAFESLFTKEMMEDVEFQLYDYMTQCLPDHDLFMKLMHDVLAGDNVCKYKTLTAYLEATRMSGEMCTSLGNGFSNLMFMLFMCDYKGLDPPKMVVEGDDGLCSIVGEIPTTSDFADLGLNLKMEIHDSLNTASFCGVVFDLDDRNNLTDPIDALMNFGWSSKDYKRCRSGKMKYLLRCKSLSLHYQYLGCPILQSLARYGLRMTEHIPVSRLKTFIQNQHSSEFNMWMRDQIAETLYRTPKDREIGIGSRFLVEQLYGIRVEHQIEIEKYLDSMTELKPIDCPLINFYCNADSKDYYDRYVREVTEKDMDRPSEVWNHYKGFQKEF